jgi:predicted dehydrogenase
LQVEAWAATILDGVPQTGASLDDGLAAVQAMVAIARSVETGKCVRLDDVSGGV